MRTHADACGRMRTYADACGRMRTYADACGRMQAARERAWQLVSGKIWDLQHSSEEYFPLDKKFHGTLIGKASVVVLKTVPFNRALIEP